MIAAEDDNGVLGQASVLQCLEKTANAVINIAD